MSQILDSIKLRLSIKDNDQDELLTDVLASAFIAVSGNLFESYLAVEDMPLKYQEVTKNAVVIYYNQQGAEGQGGASSNSVGQSFLQADMYAYIHKAMPCKPIV